MRYITSLEVMHHSKVWVAFSALVPLLRSYPYPMVQPAALLPHLRSGDTYNSDRPGVVCDHTDLQYKSAANTAQLRGLFWMGYNKMPVL